MRKLTLTKSSSNQKILIQPPSGAMRYSVSHLHKFTIVPTWPSQYSGFFLLTWSSHGSPYLDITHPHSTGTKWEGPKLSGHSHTTQGFNPWQFQGRSWLKVQKSHCQSKQQQYWATWNTQIFLKPQSF